MPTYEYACHECKTKLSEVRSIKDPEPDHFCVACGNKMTKLYFMGSPVFRGNGFYRTDK